MQGSSTQLQLGKLHKQFEWQGAASPSAPVSCSVSELTSNVSFYSDTHDYVYKGVDSSRGVQAHHWVTFPGNPFQQRDVWQPLNKSSAHSSQRLQPRTLRVSLDYRSHWF